MITFTDGKSRFVWVMLMKDKDEAAKNFEELDAWIENQLNCRIRAIRVDNAKEYVLGNFKAYADK